MNILTQFLKLLKIKHTNNFSSRLFNEHPHKYNMFGLSKVLSEYKIDNKGLRLKDKDEILKIEVPFIAHIAGSEFVIVKNATPDKIDYIWYGKSISVPFDEFKEMWTGVVLLADPDENSIEPDLKRNKRQELLDTAKNGLLISGFILIIGTLYFSNLLYNNPGITLILLANLVGIYISYLLVLSQLKISSAYADKICSLFKQSDCNNILESNAAKLFGTISWSEVGLAYFASNVVLILFNPQFITGLTIINILALPYTVWSVWYQKFKAKQWCMLCLLVQLLIWAIFAISIIFDFIKINDLKISSAIIVFFAYGFVYLLINKQIATITNARKVDSLIQEINSMKANEDVLSSYLKKQAYFDVDRKVSSIIWGNKDADILVSILTNPHCIPCGRMHKRIEKLLNSTSCNLCIQYIFSSFSEEVEISNKILIAAYKNNSNDRHTIFNDWFNDGNRNSTAFCQKYSISEMNISDTEAQTEFERHLEWKINTGLRETPTILVNGYKLPGNYKIEDLKYISKLSL